MTVRSEKIQVHGDISFYAEGAEDRFSGSIGKRYHRIIHESRATFFREMMRRPSVVEVSEAFAFWFEAIVLPFLGTLNRRAFQSDRLVMFGIPVTIRAGLDTYIVMSLKDQPQSVRRYATDIDVALGDVSFRGQWVEPAIEQEPDAED